MDRNEIDFDRIVSKLDKYLLYAFNENGTLRSDEFYNLLFKKFKIESGYYGWSVLRYFLYEYELSLLAMSVQKKVDWSDLLKNEKDKISIEHIYPQTETAEWAKAFKDVKKEHRLNYCGTLGNLLLLSRAINSSLQNESLAAKTSAKYGAGGQKIRNGYSDGSHSEIEVSQNETWGPVEIQRRGLKLLRFMEKRWGFDFGNDEERERLLFIDSNVGETISA